MKYSPILTLPKREGKTDYEKVFNFLPIICMVGLELPLIQPYDKKDDPFTFGSPSVFILLKVSLRFFISTEPLPMCRQFFRVPL